MYLKHLRLQEQAQGWTPFGDLQFAMFTIGISLIICLFFFMLNVVSSFVLVKIEEIIDAPMTMMTM